MSTINYSILFEIKVLHDYYLSQSNEQSFFDLTQNERNLKLKQLSLTNEYDIKRDLIIEPTAACARHIRNHRLKYVNTATGFFLGAEVKNSQDQANLPIQTMAIPFGRTTTWEFGISVRNPEFRSFSNIKFSNNLPAHFLFSNENLEGTKNFPSLSVPVSALVNGRTYEMGELALINGQLNQATEETSDESVGWQALVNDHRWVSQEDRKLLPRLFIYSFVNQAANSAIFTLKSVDGEDIVSIDTNHPRAIKSVDANGNLLEVTLNFRDPVGPEPLIIKEGPYTLEIIIDGDTPSVHPIHISDELYIPNNFAGIVIHSGEAGPGSEILSNSGQLIRINNTHPVFEIRLKNRNTYWRYRSQNDNKLVPKNEAVNFLDPAGNDLTTKIPKSLQRFPLQFENGGGKIFLPNPSSNRIKPENDGKIYSDIFISEVEGLIEIETQP